MYDSFPYFSMKTYVVGTQWNCIEDPQHILSQRNTNNIYLGPIRFQSIVSLTSLLVVKMLTVLVSKISNSQVFFLKKCDQLLQMQKLLTFFQQKLLVYMTC